MSERTRLETATAWIGWHLGELAGVTAPLVAAVWLSWWFALLSLVVGTLWAIQEWRTYRANAPKRVQARSDRRVLTSPTMPGETGAVVHVLPREGA
jgi:hypothetical protein